MSNTWKQYSGINHLDNTRLNNIIANNLILKNGYNGDLKINGNLNVGNITSYSINTRDLAVTNDILINGNITTNNNAIFNGNVELNGNTSINGNITFNASLNTNGDLGIGGNITVGQNAYINGNIYIPPNFIISTGNGIGINTSPISTLDIKGNATQSINVFSNNPSTFNVIAQNNTNNGLVITANTITTSIQFFNDSPINYTTPFDNNTAISQIKYTIGGNLHINTTNNLTISSRLTVIPNNQYTRNTIKQTTLAETTTIYDTSASIYLPSIYNNNTEYTGNALTLLANDTSSNTLLHIKTQSPHKGLSIGGGAYPLDQTRSMGTLGYTDPSSNSYYVGQIMISGNNIIHNTITTGINTYQPITERYALDINGETRIHNGDLRYTTPPFCVYSMSSFAGNIIAIGGYNVNATAPNKYHAYSSINGGNSWKLYSLTLGDIENTTNIFNNVFYYNATIAFIVGQNGFKGYTNNNGANWTPFTISDGVTSTLPYNATSFYAYAKDASNTRCFISYNDTTNLTISPVYFDLSTNVLYNNISPPTITITNVGTITQINTLTANTTTLFLLSGNVNGAGTYYLYSTPLASPTTITTLATYNNGFIPKGIVANGTFLAVGGTYGIYSSQNSGTSFTFTDLSTITINTFAIYSITQYVALGTNGAIYYTINAGINWTPISNDILNSAGTYGYLQNSTFNNINSATFTSANTLLFNGNIASNQANSNIYSLYAPNLFNANYNTTLDVSGSITVSGTINVNDGGFIDSNNSSFYLLNSPANIYVGNIQNKTTILGNLQCNRINTFTNLTNSYGLNTGAVIVYGGASINGNLYVGGNSTIYGNLYVNGNIDSNTSSSYLLNSPNNIYFATNASHLYVGNPQNTAVFLGNVLVQGNLTITGGSTITVDTSNSGLTTYTNLTNADRLRTGAVIIYGGSSIDGNLYIGGNITTYGNSYVGGDLYVKGNIINSNLYVYNSVSIGSNNVTPPNYKLLVTGNANITTTLFVSGNASIGKTTAPAFTLDVNGIINANALYVNGAPYIGSQWTTSGSIIYYTTGNVGIGTTSPLYSLDISGNLRATGTTIIGGNVGIGKTSPLYSLDVSGVINANALYVNGAPYIGSQWTTSGLNVYYTTGNVGIGTTSPLYNLDITGNVRITTYSTNPIILGNIGTQLYGIDLGAGDTNRGNVSNAGKIMYAPNSINGNSLVIIGKGTSITNRNIDLLDNVTISGNLTINRAIIASTTKTVDGTPYTGLVVEKTNTPDATFNLSLINSSTGVLGFNSYADASSNNPITQSGDQQIIYTDDITSGGITTFGLTIAPYDSNVSGIRLDSNGFLGICKSAQTYDTPLDVGKSAGGRTGIQTRTIQGIEYLNSQKVLHIIQPSASMANVGYNSYNIFTANNTDISAGLSIGWSSQTATNINTGTTDFLNWANNYKGGFTFHTINNSTNTTPRILMFIDSSGNKINVNKYPNYTENTLYTLNFDVSGSGRFVQDCSSLIVKCYNRSSAQTTGARIIFDSDGFVGATANSFPSTYISAIQDATNSATLNLATNNQPRMTISYSGLVGIGTTVPGYNLDVIGNGRFTTDVYTGNIYSSGSIQGNTSVGAGTFVNAVTYVNAGTYIKGKYYQEYNGTINLWCTALPTQTFSTGMNGVGASVNSGLQIGWNASGGNGETNLLNWAQYGSLGGFSFNSISSTYSNTQLATILKGSTIATLTNTAIFNMNGPINATQFYINGSAFTNTNPWTTSGSNIYYNTGNVGIGTTTPLQILDIASTQPNIMLRASGQSADNKAWGYGPNGNNLYGFLMNDANNSSKNWFQVNRTGIIVNNICFPNGNVGINTVNPGYRLDVQGDIRVYNGAVISQYYSSTTDLRIVSNSSSFNNIHINLDRTTVGGDIIMNYNSTSSNVYISNGHLYVQNGTANAVSFNATSDYRVKENLTPITTKTHNIDNLIPYSYTNKLTKKQDLGFVAHKVQQYYPEMVNGKYDDVDASGNPVYQSINYQAIIPILVAEIKELKETNKNIKIFIALMMSIFFTLYLYK